MRPSIYLHDLRQLCSHAQTQARAGGRVELKAVAFFDLSGSTELKTRRGHAAGVERVFLHNKLAADVCARYDGRVIKELGDGLLCEFGDPVKAALAALNLRKAAAEWLGFVTRVGLTVGPVEGIRVRARRDIFGSTVDRSARIQAMARGNQILIDAPFRAAVDSMLRDYPDIMVSLPEQVELKGIGPLEVMELSTRDQGFATRTTVKLGSGPRDYSPVDNPTFPEHADPARWLVCDACGGTLATDGSDGMFVSEETNRTIRAIRLYHKAHCGRKVVGRSGDLAYLTNPQLYVQFILALLTDLARTRRRLDDATGLRRLLWGMYRQVFRPSDAGEQLAFERELESGPEGADIEGPRWAGITGLLRRTS